MCQSLRGWGLGNEGPGSRGKVPDTLGSVEIAQLEALKAASATTIFKEKVSGARANRPELVKLMAKLGLGDIVVVTKLDRLGRSTRELLELIGGGGDRLILCLLRKGK